MSLTATCVICDKPCSEQQWACWHRTESGETSPVEFVCSERCLSRHDQTHATAGPEVFHGRA